MFKFDPKTLNIIKCLAEYASSLPQTTPLNIYFVGGMVRDILMGNPKIKDIDILVEGSAIAFVEAFNESLNESLNGSVGDKNCILNIKSVHKSFDTVKALINGVEIDFASTREETYPYPGCLPVVKNVGCEINCDLKRRDFTVNAIAAKILADNNTESGLRYEIIDPFNGQNDIKQGVLHVLHNESYVDDPTRVLRGLDFSLRFGFNFSADDKALIEKCLKNPDRTGLSIDRVRLTLKKLFSNPLYAKEAYEKIHENKYYKIWQDTPSFQAKWAERLLDAAFNFNVPKEELFLSSIFNPESFIPVEQTALSRTNFEIYNTYRSLKPLDLALSYAIYNDENALYYYKNLKNIKPLVTGNELIKELDFKEGKRLGNALNFILKTKLNNPNFLKTKEDEINLIKDNLKLFL